jgi:hypothetical protein
MKPVIPLRGDKTDESVRYYKAISDFINSTIRYRRNFPEWHSTPLSWWRELRKTPEVVIAEFRARDYRVALFALFIETQFLVKQMLGIRRFP